MKLLLPVDKGCEEACVKEIQSLIGKKARVVPGYVSLDVNMDDVAFLVYRAQVPLYILAEIAKVEDPHDFEKVSPDMELIRTLVPEGRTFRANAHGAEKFHSQELVEGLGGWFHTACGHPVNLSAPECVVIACETKEGIIAGVDLVGKNLSKRDWRIMLSRRSLRATVAAAAVIYSGISSNDVILDPLSDDGTLVIELAMHLSGISPRRYEKQLAIEGMSVFDIDWNSWKKNRDSEANEDLHIVSFSNSHSDMKAVKQNAKLAGVEKMIKISRVPVDWMDLKLDEKSINSVLTYPAVSGRTLSVKQAEKKADDLFNQAKYVLGTGNCTVVTLKPEETIPVAEKHGFKVKEEHKVLMGKQEISIVVMRC